MGHQGKTKAVPQKSPSCETSGAECSVVNLLKYKKEQEKMVLILVSNASKFITLLQISNP